MNNERQASTGKTESKSEYLNERCKNQPREILKPCRGDKRQLPKRNDLIREQQHEGRDERRMRENNSESPETDIDFHSEDRGERWVKNLSFPFIAVVKRTTVDT